MYFRMSIVLCWESLQGSGGPVWEKCPDEGRDGQLKFDGSPSEAGKSQALLGGGLRKADPNRSSYVGKCVGSLKSASLKPGCRAPLSGPEGAGLGQEEALVFVGAFHHQEPLEPLLTAA